MTNTPTFKLTLRAAALALWACHAHAAAAQPVQPTAPVMPIAPIAPIATLDVPRYMGTWFEIAKFPNRFQRKCARNTAAEYALQGDGTVRVANRCRTAQGDTLEAIGQARQIGAATSPKLEVRFAPAWLSFLPMVWGDYWVIDLDARYQLVAVSEPRREFLWVLSRTPQVDAPAYQALLGRLTQQGFDVARLERTPQE
jgi:apolipoprotein D and lipocalin family protein